MLKYRQCSGDNLSLRDDFIFHFFFGYLLYLKVTNYHIWYIIKLSHHIISIAHALYLVCGLNSYYLIFRNHILINYLFQYFFFVWIYSSSTGTGIHSYLPSFPDTPIPSVSQSGYLGSGFCCCLLLKLFNFIMKGFMFLFLTFLALGDDGIVVGIPLVILYPDWNTFDRKIGS